MITKFIKYEDIDPKLTGSNWNVIWTKKVEIINDEVYSDVPKDHWFSKVVERHGQFTTLGFYTNPAYPNELIRVAGLAPDLQVILFTKKE
jgi:hypothetical protein